MDGEVVSTNASYSFNVTGATVLVANFMVNSYTVSATPNPAEGGSVAFLGNSTVNQYVYDFENGTTQGWTILQGTNGDSPNNWMHCLFVLLSYSFFKMRIVVCVMYVTSEKPHETKPLFRTAKAVFRYRVLFARKHTHTQTQPRGQNVAHHPRLMEKRQTPAKDHGKATLYPKTASQRRRAAPFSAGHLYFTLLQ